MLVTVAMWAASSYPARLQHCMKTLLWFNVLFNLLLVDSVFWLWIKQWTKLWILVYLLLAGNNSTDFNSHEPVRGPLTIVCYASLESSGLLMSLYWYLGTGGSSGDTFHTQYQYGYRRYFFTYFLATFNTNIFVIRCTVKSVNNITVT